MAFPLYKAVKNMVNVFANLDRYFQDGGYVPTTIGAPSTAGIKVTPQNALQFSAVFACVRIIAETIGPLSWHVFEKNGTERLERRDHPIDFLIHDEPNHEITANIFKEILIAHGNTWGNGYAEIERNLSGKPIALWPIEPHRVTVKRNENGQIYYEIYQDDGTNYRLNPENVFHLRGLGYEGIVGYSPIRLAQESIGLGIAMEQFGSSFFGNGAHLSGVLEVPGKLDEPAYKRLRESWNEMYRGTQNANKTGILEQGTKFSKISVPPEEAQFITSRQFQITEIARWFRVPPHKLAELSRATFSNIEQMAKEFVDDCIIPWVSRLEVEGNRKLLTREERVGGLYTKINLRGLLRGDAQSRSAFYQTLMDRGVYSINEVRALEDENPVTGGDIRMVPLNMVSLDQANQNGNTGQNQNE